MDFTDLEPKLVWLAGFIALYWIYCVFWGLRGAAAARSASDYFIAGRGLGTWAFILAATATSFSGWTFLGHPGLIYRDGFQYAYASFYAVTIPLTGVLFMKRQWLLGKRFGFVTPGEMFGEYFRSHAIRLLVVLVALIFTIPFLGVQLRASGFLINSLSDGILPIDFVIYALSFVVFLYVAAGGLRAVAYVDMLQCILLGFGMIVIGLVTLAYIGGFDRLVQGIELLIEVDRNRTPDGYSHYVAIPGVIQWSADGPSATGGAWTAVMILTYMMALMGIQSTPAFTMWAFASRSPHSFAPQQVWASAFAVGFILFVFAAIQGIGGHLLGADTAMNNARGAGNLVSDALSYGLGDNDIMDVAGQQDVLVPQLINLMADSMPWLVGLLGVCAIAAMQSTGAVYLSTFSAMLTRDVMKEYLMPDATHRIQKTTARLFVAVVIVLSLFFAVNTTDYLVLAGGLAVAFGFQMWPALIAVCYAPFFTRTGIIAGLIFGIIGVLLTEKIGGQLAILFGFELPWGRWPLTMHSAFWGMLANLTAALFVSAVTQSRDAYDHRMRFHEFLRSHGGVPEDKRYMIPIAWIIALVWFFFAIGPGAVIGNWIFGDPNDAATWTFGIPSIWAWQILWWAAGVLMLWFLAYRVGLSTLPNRAVQTLNEDFGDRAVRNFGAADPA
ncbi:MAG: sodium:solute symporter family protein [Hyphomicrobiaceae bacterium]